MSHGPSAVNMADGCTKQILDTKDLRCPSTQLPGYAGAPRSHQFGSQSLDLAYHADY
ncbi:hypothetical protein SNOG_06804 [Parastagonospora nodorum SN15]|uniref:Uncharacterized protein n=2 Tax=Phaeosphaeria nodorum (strain SN15 / ATCC MYA-4574 / FGSC 10173) TaxID=321614 RepID=A0A7U2I1I3_PHANO|nr:hypothetical protein SNOG_06804 [Parastagonospora nodorum SN15]EAT85455.1 hypothetical protein SNOG_06804 [Parastagonospora nodorum SN15]QRC99870.1 hypothetical protein JI435_068040 [Parastagonospora nodorum SN15]